MSTTDDKSVCWCAGCGRKRREWIWRSDVSRWVSACRKCGSHTVVSTKPVNARRRRVGEWTKFKGWRRARRLVLQMKHAFMPFTKASDE